MSETRRLRQALGRFATGVTVVTTRGPSGRLEGVTVNSFSAVSLDPPLILWSLRRDSGVLASFLKSRAFAVNVLAAEQQAVSRRFAAAGRKDFSGLAYRLNEQGCPLIDDCLAGFDCTTESTIEAGDHVIFIGRVHRSSHRDGDPLVFSGGRYHGLGPPQDQT